MHAMTPRALRGFTAALLAALVGLAPVVAQQRLTNVCVVDVSKVNQAFFRESKRAKEYQAFRDLVKQELKTMDADIEELRIKKVDATRANNSSEANRVDRQIAEKQAERDTYARLQEQKRIRMLEDLQSNDKYFRDLVAAIEWVCHQEGYALAFNLAETPLLWFDPDVDVTDKVIQRMSSQ
jgi:outer membrane protein